MTLLKQKGRYLKIASAAFIAALILAGCSGAPVHDGARPLMKSTSSLVDYLYPNGEQPPGIAQDIPRLTVPVRVGIAFVPDKTKSPTVSHRVKLRLLRQVKRQFAYHRVVQQIRIIPPGELRPHGGFRELRDVAQRYNVDLIALVSHNQINAIQHNSLSISYLTIVGALVIPGNSHNISTFVDTAVFDVESGKLLFRAAGTDRIYQQTSAFALTEKNASISRNSMNKATGHMVSNLKMELTKFRKRVQAGSKEADVRYRRNYAGKRYNRRSHGIKRRLNDEPESHNRAQADPLRELD